MMIRDRVAVIKRVVEGNMMIDPPVADVMNDPIHQHRHQDVMDLKHLVVAV